MSKPIVTARDNRRGTALHTLPPALKGLVVAKPRVQTGKHTTTHIKNILFRLNHLRMRGDEESERKI